MGLTQFSLGNPELRIIPSQILTAKWCTGTFAKEETHSESLQRGVRIRFVIKTNVRGKCQTSMVFSALPQSSRMSREQTNHL